MIRKARIDSVLKGETILRSARIWLTSLGLMACGGGGGGEPPDGAAGGEVVDQGVAPDGASGGATGGATPNADASPGGELVPDASTGGTSRGLAWLRPYL